MRKQWKKFDSISDQCYSSVVRGTPRLDKWSRGFDLLVKIIEDGRSEEPGFARELYLLDVDTDYAHDVYGWLMDYMDELASHGMYEELEDVCRKLLQLFAWEEEFPSELNFHLAYALEGQEKNEEALEFCEEWQKNEANSPIADAALIHAKIAVEDLSGAEEIMQRYMTGEGSYNINNEELYMAAKRLYRENGDKKAARKVQKAWRSTKHHYSNLF